MLGGKRGAYLAATCVVALLADLAPAVAQTAGIEEVTVTARRREERLQDVPVAVTAFGPEKLRNLQATNLGDLQGSVPNIDIHVGDASNAVVYIRGVGQIDSLAFADPGVGIYLDDVYLGRAQGAFLDVYDVDRIEVLRGPQGTLYGRNTIGGAVKFVSKPLTNDVAGTAELTVGDYARIEAKGSLNFPIVTDKVLAKVAIGHLSHDGFAQNSVTGKDEGGKDTLVGRAALEFRPSDSLTIRFDFDGSNDTPSTSRTPSRRTPVFGVPANSDPFKVAANFSDLSNLRTAGAAMTINWNINDTLRLKSISAFRRMGYDARLDDDATAQAFFGVYDNERQNQFSQEVQLNYTGERLNAVGGLYYFREHDNTLSGLFGPAIGLITGSVNDATNISYAAYGQATYNVTSKLSATAGLRYTYEDKKFLRTQRFYAATQTYPVPYDNTNVPFATNINMSDNWSSMSPKFGLDYHLSDDVLLYVSASRGFKSGGFDGRANDNAGARAYAPETLWSYEAGLKSTWLDRRLIVNVAIFDNEYKDLQLSSFVADRNGNFAALFTNAGAATMRGAELEVTARPIAPLSITATLGYLDAHYDQFIGAGGTDISKQRKLVNAPRWNGKLAGTYRIDLGSNGGVVLGADIAYRTKSYPVVSSSEVLAQGGYALANAFVRYEAPSDRWWLSLGAKNLTDRRYITQGFDLSDSLGYQLAYYGDPRTVAATFGVRF
ncbi:TonB-dependent receptor [Roseiterribacter gracilis]|uniref:TonB-dependent receptor n=1 Tax=Roseiterribacter gracilis TaxID=2812848 RepID=A0A8S8X9B3_9PROT|nr:TonB-dependent receptor [Rhodospirillales bacterium TMPK1]